MRIVRGNLKRKKIRLFKILQLQDPLGILLKKIFLILLHHSNLINIEIRIMLMILRSYILERRFIWYRVYFSRNEKKLTFIENRSSKALTILKRNLNNLSIN